MERCKHILPKLLLLALSGCADSGPTSPVTAHQRFLSQLSEPAGSRYAFSARLISAATESTVSNYSVSVLSKDTAISAVINPLGSHDGQFHISRNPSHTEAMSAPISVVVNAPGFQSETLVFDISADCTTAHCGLQPIHSIKLRPRNAMEQLPGSLSFASQRKPLDAVEKRRLFSSLIETQKIDGELARKLSSATNAQVIDSVVVKLSEDPGALGTGALLELMRSIQLPKLDVAVDSPSESASDWLPLMISLSPELVEAIVSIKPILSYYRPIIDEMAASIDSPVIRSLQAILLENHSTQTVAEIFGAIQDEDFPVSNQTRLASVGLLGLMTKSARNSSVTLTNQGVEGLFSVALAQPRLLQALSSSSYDESPATSKSVTLEYLKPLVQALIGKKGPELGYLLNQLVRKRGVQAIKQFPRNLKEQESYAKLIPYVERIVAGLNGEAGGWLETQLESILKANNPALILRRLVYQTSDAAFGLDHLQVLRTIYPGLARREVNSIQAKQLFATQLLSGIVNRDLHAAKISVDLRSSASVVVKGQARDIFKLALLPNVERLMLTPAAPHR